jgi:VIT1/CCC1 family predicted Fe2+/Mn2+ transporter
MAAMETDCIAKDAVVTEAFLCSEQSDVSIAIPEIRKVKGDDCITKEAAVTEAFPCSEQYDVRIAIPEIRKEKVKENESRDNYQQRGQWLRAAVLGANDGLVSIASLMMGVGAVKSDAKVMVVSGRAALVAGACSMAIGEFVSVYTQRDAEVRVKKLKALVKSTKLREHISSNSLSSSPTTVTTASPAASTPVPEVLISGNDDADEHLPNPFQAACASALAFCVGGAVPLLSAAFITDYVIRVVTMGGASSVALALFGAVGAYYGRSPMVKGSMRVLIGGWMAMLVTYGLLKLLGASSA